MPRYIFITGGVVSSLGKGLASAALGALLQSRGYKVRLRKLDPYLNVDPGTMSPYQHGEVYVTDDGAETDLDLGHYERFTGVSAAQSDNAGEMKTKPTQHSVKELRSIGIQPDILLCRADREIDPNDKRKIARFTNVRESSVIQGLDARSIYDVPLAYYDEGLDREVLAHFGVENPPPADLSKWQAISDNLHNPDGKVTTCYPCSWWVWGTRL